MSKFTNIIDAWDFLAYDSKVFFDPRYEGSRFLEGLHICPVLVNPKTNKIDDDESKNTKIRIWLEPSVLIWDKSKKADELTKKDIRWSHFWEYDCEGDTFEDAIIKLANMIYYGYGYEGLLVDCPF